MVLDACHVAVFVRAEDGVVGGEHEVVRRIIHQPPTSVHSELGQRLEVLRKALLRWRAEYATRKMRARGATATFVDVPVPCEAHAGRIALRPLMQLRTFMA